jgi:hypothetical protein
MPDIPTFSTFAYEAETELVSHRGLFQSVFGGTSGVIVHLGDKDLQKYLDRGEWSCWFAGDLIAWSEKRIVLPGIDMALGDDQWWGEGQMSLFRFKPEVVPDVRQLLEILLRASPAGRAMFSTDIQFGPAEGRECEGYSIERLFREHETVGLAWNCLYHINRE